MSTPKPGIHQFLIASALDADLRQRLLETPDEAFRNFHLTDEEKDLLRHPDHRLLPLLGATLAGQSESSPSAPAPPSERHPHAVIPARTLPDISLALTLVPCAQDVDGQLSISYAVWVNPLPEGTDPASLPPPPGAALPGRPLAPLHAVIQISAVQLQDAAGNPQVGLTAALRQSSNMAAPMTALAPPQSGAGSPEVQAAVAAVRSAPREERFGRLIDLIRAVQGGESR